MIKDYNTRMQFPTGANYVNRITEASFEVSKAGNAMLKLTAEVVSPEVVEVGEDDVNIAGVETTNYYVVTNFNKDGTEDEEKTTKSRERLETLYNNLGLDYKSIDFDNPDASVFRGLVVLSSMRGEFNEQHAAPTRAQVAKNLPGDVMKNPKTGQTLGFYKPTISEIFGIAPEGIASKATGNKPY
jgi:hypothetical protein